MNPAGLLLVFAGVLVACQVFGGEALERFNLT